MSEAAIAIGGAGRVSENHAAYWTRGEPGLVFGEAPESLSPG
jgi:hypothetical protein